MINEVILKRMNSGRIFTVQFVKKDGSIRVMNCRSGVKKNLKGVGFAFDPIKKGLYPVYDVQKEAYRFINMKTIKEITFYFIYGLIGISITSTKVKVLILPLKTKINF